ncbi:hypothetical protein NE865_14671 [Phthorimaea operculella]|nr:hypothetical protein NE865_14671 [Phthorimaea operculella]
MLTTCRDRSDLFRQDGGLCFEIPPWQHQPVELDGHVARLRRKWGLDETLTRKQTPSRLTLNNGDISRYMDTVIGPFLDTYHLNIQNSYQQLTSKILRRIKEEVNAAVKTKQQIYKNLTALADELEVPPLCDEERRKARNIATNHVSLTYACTEDARVSIAKMGKYAEQMIALTKKHMQKTVSDTIKTFDLNKVNGSVLKSEIESCLESLSEAAVNLGYELDLSLTNARRHNEQSCEKLTGCVTKARKRSEEGVAEVKDLLYQCVYS